MFEGDVGADLLMLIRAGERSSAVQLLMAKQGLFQFYTGPLVTVSLGCRITWKGISSASLTFLDGFW